MKIKQTTAIEQYIIDKVRTMRKDKGISQAGLANLIDKPHGFIGRVESPNQPDKYNLNHLNRIAEAMECRIWDLVPEWPIGE